MEKKLIHTQQELEALPAGATVWGSSNRFPEVPGSGSPYTRLLSYNETRPEDSPYDDALWWDYGNDFAVGPDDIMLPAVLVWDGVA